MKILIADDSVIVRRNLRKLISSSLNETGILESDSVESTIRLIETETPDVVILDIQLPDGTGIDVLSWMQEKNPRPVVIMLTNYPDTGNRNKCLSLGADYFFDKSNEYERVTTALKSIKQDGGMENA